MFQTPAWIRFIAESQNATPAIATLKDGGTTLGYFAGLTVKKAGFKILGSPFIGWGTERMGLRLLPGVSKPHAVEAITRYAFGELKCSHFEFGDAAIAPDDVAGLGFSCKSTATPVVDLTADEDAIYSRMSSKSCRYCIRKAEKLGVIIEEAKDDAFADEYCDQMRDVFAKQRLVPTYGVDRVRLLMKHLLPTGNLLLLRARESEGRCIATGIFLGMHETAFFWGNSSWRADQHFCPNESLHWYAMRYWKRRGAKSYDFCGGGEYKRKYGGVEKELYHFTKSKYRWLSVGRNMALKSFRMYQRIAGWQKK
ncbi:MAG: GNAT family N-acetyltransferase [Planctomycetaceae bacterium]|nr:GNAT family N-acetyltransferase [Planctomycetaceae bacterium]